MSHLPVPVSVLNAHCAILGKTGAGKSSLLRVIVEDLLRRGKRVCVVDPKGDWYGLKLQADGKTPGYPVITFGDFVEEKATDVPINKHSGKHVAELISSGNRPCVIGFRGWMPGTMTEFWIDFASTLFNSKSGELYLIIDECHNFMPKGKVLDPQAGKCLHWSNRIMSEARGLGIVALIASQRPQKVHNDSLTCCETLFAMRVVHAADRGAIKDWIDGCADRKQGEAVLNGLAMLSRGQAFVWSPENEYGPKPVQFPMFTTFDSFAPPQLQKKIGASGWAGVDLDAVKAKLATVIEEAKANDPAELKRRIRDLEKQIATAIAKPTGPPPEPTTITKEVMVLRSEDIESFHATRKECERLQDAVNAAFAGLADVGKRLEAIQTTQKLRIDPPLRHRLIVPPRQPSAPARMAAYLKPKHPVDGDAAIAPAKQRILNGLAFLAGIGVGHADKTQLALIVGVSPTSGGYFNNLGSLRTDGLIEYPSGGTVALTDAGRAVASTDGVPSTTTELHEAIRAKLPPAKWKILETLIAAYPQPIDKNHLAENIGVSPTSGGYFNNLGSLRSLGLIDYPRGGEVVALPVLFLD